MKLTDLIIARDRLKAEIESKPATAPEMMIQHMAHELDPYAGVWSKHVLHDPSDNKPFENVLVPLCAEAINNEPENANLYGADKIPFGARLLRLATLEFVLKKIAEGEIVLEDVNTTPSKIQKPAPLTPMIR